ncbi:DNA cytosine methyltransferase, partial [Acinetobacter baumannii]|nr:DNA cytosine methyltransferase [Acinetobacter baumannii]
MEQSKILDLFDTVEIDKADFSHPSQSVVFDSSKNKNSKIKKVSFTFIDLFAGIGGFRIAMQNLGGKCVFSSEWDIKAQQTYAANFGDIPFGDITLEATKQNIPDGFDILCA